MVVMVGLVAVVLVIAGAGSLILTRNAARNQAEQQLVSEVNALTSSKIGSQSLAVLRVVRKTLKLEDADIIQIDRFGSVVTTLPEGLTPQDINVAALQAGETTSGRKGNTVYAVAPVTLSQQELTKLRERRHVTFEGTFAVLLTRDVSGLGPSWGYFSGSRGSSTARRGAGGLADVASHGPAPRRGHGGHRPHCVGRAGQPGPGPAWGLPGIRLVGRLHQQHGPEPGGQPGP